MTAGESCVLLVDAIQDLAAARARIEDLGGERDQWREIAVCAIDALARLTARVEHQSQTIIRLIDELRALRGQGRAA